IHSEDSPAISALTPPRIPAGGAGFALTVTGSGFVEGAVVRWNASALDTFSVDSTQLSSTVPAELIGTPGEATVSILNSGGAQSVQVSFVIDLLVIPTLISVSPISAVRGAAPFTLAVTGRDFVSGAVVQFNKAALPTTSISSAELRAQVPAALTANAGTAPVVVTNPPAVK